MEKEIKEKIDELKFLEDVEVRVTVSVGKAHKMFAEIMNMKVGDIIKLDKNVEDYIDIYVNGKFFAIGEMMVVNEKFSVRVIDIA